VQDSVHLPGFVSNPYPLLARATVFALPSRLEGFAVVLLEAMALGVPVVAADCVAGPAEVLAGGACGHLVRPDDPEALADGLSRLLGDRGYRERLVAAGRQRVQEYLPERIVPRWERILVEVCQ
jgi:glycosyltransferase involved in cell wall biosynthesis